MKTFVHQVSSKHIPTGIQEALADPNWSQAIQEEMSALQKKSYMESCFTSERKEDSGLSMGIYYKI